MFLFHMYKSSKPPFLGVSGFIFRGDGKNLENNFPFHQPEFRTCFHRLARCIPISPWFLESKNFQRFGKTGCWLRFPRLGVRPIRPSSGVISNPYAYKWPSNKWMGCTVVFVLKPTYSWYEPTSWRGGIQHLPSPSPHLHQNPLSLRTLEGHKPGRPQQPDVDMGASENGGTSKSSISIGMSIINHPFLGYPYDLETPIFVVLLLKLEGQKKMVKPIS